MQTAIAKILPPFWNLLRCCTVRDTSFQDREFITEYQYSLKSDDQIIFFRELFHTRPTSKDADCFFVSGGLYYPVLATGWQYCKQIEMDKGLPHVSVQFERYECNIKLKVIQVFSRRVLYVEPFMFERIMQYEEVHGYYIILSIRKVIFFIIWGWVLRFWNELNNFTGVGVVLE